MKNITIIITTNPVEWWSPSTKLIQHTTSQPVLQQLKSSSCMICCDVDSDKHEYYTNLQHVEYIFDEVRHMHNTPERNGLKWLMINSAEQIKTPYVLFLEHDWFFEAEIDWNKLVELMDRYTFINKISFNKRTNEIMTKHPVPFKEDDPVVTNELVPRLGIPRFGCKNDTYMEYDERLKNSEIKLLRALRWTNNPFLARTTMFQQWMNSINDGKTCRTSKGVEEVLISRYRSECYINGWDTTSNKWGVYIYGDFNDPRAVRHSNGKARHW